MPPPFTEHQIATKQRQKDIPDQCLSVPIVDYIPWTTGLQARTFAGYGQALCSDAQSVSAPSPNTKKGTRNFSRTTGVRRESRQDLRVADRAWYRQPFAFGAVQAFDGLGHQSAGTLFEGRLTTVGAKARSCLDDISRALAASLASLLPPVCPTPRNPGNSCQLFS